MQQRKHQTVYPDKRRKFAYLPAMLDQNSRSRKRVVKKWRILVLIAQNRS